MRDNAVKQIKSDLMLGEVRSKFSRS